MSENDIDLENARRVWENKITETVRRGKELYGRLANTLEHNFPNKFVVIDVVTGEYVTEEDLDRSLEKANKTFPQDHRRYIQKIGDPNHFRF